MLEEKNNNHLLCYETMLEGAILIFYFFMRKYCFLYTHRNTVSMLLHNPYIYITFLCDCVVNDLKQGALPHEEDCKLMNLMQTI